MHEDLHLFIRDLPKGLWNIKRFCLRISRDLSPWGLEFGVVYTLSTGALRRPLKGNVSMVEV